MDRRQRLVEIFEDTQQFYMQNALLANAVHYSTRNIVGKNRHLIGNRLISFPICATMILGQGGVSKWKANNILAQHRLLQCSA